MQVLKARTDILYLGTLYKPGDKLPANNEAMVKAWTEAKTAVWVDDEAKAETAKAKPITAEPGLAGAAVASEAEDGENLVGKVPKTAGRKKK